jgi:hypothetical protein
VEPDFILTAAVAIVRVQYGRMFIGKHGPFHYFGRAEPLPEFFERATSPTASFTRHGFAECAVAGEHVVIHQRRRLVAYFVVHKL